MPRRWLTFCTQVSARPKLALTPFSGHGQMNLS